MTPRVTQILAELDLLSAEQQLKYLADLEAELQRLGYRYLDWKEDHWEETGVQSS